MQKQPISAIVLTLSQGLIKKRRGGFKTILREWHHCTADSGVQWWYRSQTAPKYPERIEAVYWTIGGKIRYKCKLACVEKEKEMTFSELNPPLYGKNWFVLFDFEEVPTPQRIEYRGFQGFRYFDAELLTA